MSTPTLTISDEQSVIVKASTRNQDNTYYYNAPFDLYVSTPSAVKMITLEEISRNHKLFTSAFPRVKAFFDEHALPSLAMGRYKVLQKIHIGSNATMVREGTIFGFVADVDTNVTLRAASNVILEDASRKYKGFVLVPFQGVTAAPNLPLPEGHTEVR